MATIPVIRRQLELIADEPRTWADRLESADLDRIAGRLDLLRQDTKRRRFAGPRKVVSPKATPELREQIRAFARANPDLAQIEIANKFGVNAGRVSEALHGWRR
jgi:hypothetical protein